MAASSDAFTSSGVLDFSGVPSGFSNLFVVGLNPGVSLSPGSLREVVAALDDFP